MYSIFGQFSKGKINASNLVGAFANIFPQIFFQKCPQFSFVPPKIPANQILAAPLPFSQCYFINCYKITHLLRQCRLNSFRIGFLFVCFSLAHLLKWILKYFTPTTRCSIFIYYAAYFKLPRVRVEDVVVVVVVLHRRYQ